MNLNRANFASSALQQAFRHDASEGDDRIAQSTHSNSMMLSQSQNASHQALQQFQGQRNPNSNGRGGPNSVKVGLMPCQKFKKRAAEALINESLVSSSEEGKLTTKSDGGTQTDDQEIRLRNAQKSLPGYLKREIVKTDSLLSCQICLQKFNTEIRLPICLPCGHSVCRYCADSLIKAGKRKCPFDNKPFECRGVESLGKNFSLLDLLEAEKHKMKRADERHCEVHPCKKVKFYCRTHSAFVCSECLLAEHLGHNIVPARPLILGDVVSQEITQVITSVSKLKHQAESHLSMIEDIFNKDDALIEAAGLKLVEEI